jgi:hypothetical protein
MWWWSLKYQIACAATLFWLLERIVLWRMWWEQVELNRKVMEKLFKLYIMFIKLVNAFLCFNVVNKKNSYNVLKHRLDCTVLARSIELFLLKSKKIIIQYSPPKKHMFQNGVQNFTSEPKIFWSYRPPTTRSQWEIGWQKFEDVNFSNFVFVFLIR